MGLNNQLWVAVVVIMAIILEGWGCHGCWEHERIALLQLKDAFNFPNGTSYDMSSWGRDTNCCNWELVRCNETTGRVTELNLWLARDRSLNSSWYLNASLFLPFEELEFLQLSGNNIAGFVGKKGVGEALGLKNLRYMYLSDNRFNNSIFSSLKKLSSLELLHLYGNQLKGSINIEDLNAFINLESLDLSGNEINKFICKRGVGEALGLKNLRTLHLSWNRFNNGVLSFVRRLSSLEFLYLNNNQLRRGSINIEELDTFMNLKRLDLSGNDIDKFICRKGLRKLRHLGLNALFYEKETRVRLQILGEFPQLRVLDIGFNNFVETIFSSKPGLNYSWMTNLEELYLDNSSLDENCLQSIGSLFPSLRLLSCSGCNIPTKGLPLLKKMEELQMDYCTIGANSAFLHNIGRLTSLRSLSMSSCSGLNRSTLLTAVNGLCDLKHLQHLDLSYNNLSGSLPPCFSNLTSLQRVDLSCNHLSGSISTLNSLTSIEELWLFNNYFQIPISFGLCFNHSKLHDFYGSGNEVFAEEEVHIFTPKFQLCTLYFSGHGYGGALPEFLYYQHELAEVDLSHIQMKGEFPQWLLDNNTNLFKLCLVNNSLSGTVRLPIHSHVNLSLLDISLNRFQGHMPKAIGIYFPSLIYLNMSGNSLSSSIPSSLGNMSSLGFLDLSNNRLSGRIPKFLTMGCFSLLYLKLSNNMLQGQVFSNNVDLKNLVMLILDRNHFTGSIPNSISNCTSLKLLDISYNQLSGKMPRWVKNLTSLTALDLSRNNIFGSVTFGVFSPEIRHIYLSKNRLESLEDGFYHFPYLRTLDLGHNHLIGNIPKWIGKCSQLSYFLLSHNKLNGELPIQLCKLNQLRLVDVSHNALSGHIPSCISLSNDWHRLQLAPTDLEEKTFNSKISYLDRSHVSEQQPLEFTIKSISYDFQVRILTYLSGIDLSCNKLGGKIPVEFGNLRDIQSLNLSHNGLTGTIPPTFSNLKQIESLDLSYNKLNGEIPHQLTSLNFLSVFNVAHNNLSGQIPQIAQFSTFNESSYKENPFLCGLPLQKRCTEIVPASSLPRTSSNESEESGFIDMRAFWVTFLVAYSILLLTFAAILYINPYWRKA